jgi:uncharacterized protein YdhG (YjbR/CyaY superfamily)
MNSVDKYILAFPKNVQEILINIRKIIKKAAPDAEETIGYGMPAFKLNGYLVFFAAYKNHIGFYPTPSGISAFKKDISRFKYAKGSVQFPFDKPIPFDLIRKIVKYRAKENHDRSKL